MRRILLAIPLTAVVAAVLFVAQATAQTTKTARGTVTAMAGDTVTIKAADQEMKFGIDSKTRVTAEGGTTAARQAEAAGKPGPTLSELVKVGNAVEVTYTESGGTMRATAIRRVRDVGTPGDTKAEETATGVIDSIKGNTLTISGSSGGGATFKQSFTVDNTTRVIAVGAGTAAAAAGGKLVLTEHVGPGDRVTVTYHKLGDTLHVSELRVRERAKK